MAAEPVKLYVYDLSQGLAKQMSLSLTGRQIDGIWHTAVVLYGHEFYYGQGIQVSTPGGTHLGPPLQIIDIGETFLPEEVVIEYIESQRSVFTAEKYHLLDFNCNTFSNDLCQFLTGTSIPKHITDLPSDFLNTPFGQSLLPMIENMFGKSRLAPPAAAAAAAATATASAQRPPNAQALGVLQDINSAALSAAPSQQLQPIQTAQNLAMLERWIQSYKAVIVFFTSATCPPCRMIKPQFEQLLQDRNAGRSKIRILGVIVDTSVAFDAAAKYGIRATPTFMLFQDGNKFSEFKGANYAELQSSVDILLFTAYPPHPHRKIHLRRVIDLPNEPVLYTTFGDIDKIFGKLQDFIQQSNLTLDSKHLATLEAARNAIKQSYPNVDINAEDWQSVASFLLEKLPVDRRFPLLDIFRIMLFTETGYNHYLKDCTPIVHIIESGYQTDSVTKATLLMTLRIACNLFARNSTLVTTYFSSALATSSYRSVLTQLLVNSLLSADSQVRQTAAALAFNWSTIIAKERLRKEEEGGDSLQGTPEQEDSDWEIEVVSAVMDVLSKEKDEEVVHRLLAAISKFLFLAPADLSPLPDLLQALDIKAILESKRQEKIIVSPKVVTLARDLENLVDQSLDIH
ncbi:hypothetical protein VTP01DRAFT_9350 [Rhizomucor pusillus]|uniref:uncharacterized protein n=1 Tax=Rhizomucor pusillus TaxID=4840 RepID=UPI0037436B41